MNDTTYANLSQFRLVYLHASPLGTPLPLLDIKEEITMLRDCLGRTNRQIRLKVDVATPKNLKSLVTLGAVMIHYSGHGAPDLLAFENENGGFIPLGGELLKNLLRAGDRNVRTKVVFVSACHSESAGCKFVDAGIEHVIALKNDERVTDRLSRDFAYRFYFELVRGGTVQYSFDTAAQLHGETKFLLLPSNTSHDVVIFNDVPPGPYIDETSPLAPNYCDSVPKCFVGRTTEMAQIFLQFANKSRLVTIIGERGIGKTVLALKTCSHMNERHLFDGIYFIPLCQYAFGSGNNDDLFYSQERLAELMISGMKEKLEGANALGELVSKLNNHKRNRSQSGGEHRDLSVLFVLDGCDDFLPTAGTWTGQQNNANLFEDGHNNVSEDVRYSHSSDFGNQQRHRTALLDIINTLLRRTEGTKFLLTSKYSLLHSDEYMTHEPEKEVVTNGLNRLESAELLVRLSPRALTAVELNTTNPVIMNPSQPSKSTIECLSERHIFADLEGNPRAIFLFATGLKSRDLDDSVDIRNLAKEKFYKAVEWKEKRAGVSGMVPGVRIMSPSHSLVVPENPRPTHISRSQTEFHVVAPLSLRVSKSSGNIAYPDDSDGVHGVSDLPTMNITSSDRGKATIKPTVQRDMDTARQVASTVLTDPLCIEAWATLTSSPVQRPMTNTNPPAKSVKWHHLTTELSKIMHQILFNDAVHAVKNNRHLTGDDWEFVRERIDPDTTSANMNILSNERRPSDYLVDIYKFKKLCDWFCPLLRSIKYLRSDFLSVSPILIHGFLSRQRAEHMLLETGMIGVFLLRFSESRPGLLVVSLTDMHEEIDSRFVSIFILISISF